MTIAWLEDVRRGISDGPVVRVVVIGAEGSSPREVGAAMIVGACDISGTIGGGALEFEAIAAARAMAADGGAFARQVKAYPLGPALNQCCGGHVTLLFERYGAIEIEAINGDMGAFNGVIVHPLASGAAPVLVASRRPIAGVPLHVGRVVSQMLSGVGISEGVWLTGRDNSDGYFVEPIGRPKQAVFLYGAGHVGREVVRVMWGLDIALSWVDTSEDRFPEFIRDDVRRIVTNTPDSVAAAAPAAALHLVMTYSHALDERICRAVLQGPGFEFLGLIGSKTKRARFVQRLARAGVPEAQLTRLVSPIGIDGVKGKAPIAIAISVAAQVIRECERVAAARMLVDGGKRVSAIRL